MVVTVVGCSGGACGGGFAEHGGGCCPLTCRASTGLPAPPLQAASTRAAERAAGPVLVPKSPALRTSGHDCQSPLASLLAEA